jgi:hypothetical protein
MAGAEVDVVAFVQQDGDAIDQVSRRPWKGQDEQRHEDRQPAHRPYDPSSRARKKSHDVPLGSNLATRNPISFILLPSRDGKRAPRMFAVVAAQRRNMSPLRKTLTLPLDELRAFTSRDLRGAARFAQLTCQSRQGFEGSGEAGVLAPSALAIDTRARWDRRPRSRGSAARVMERQGPGSRRAC